MKENFKEFGGLFWLHLLLIVAAWLSPVLFSWWLVVLGVGVYYVHLLVFKGCVLTAAEFGPTHRGSFYGHYLKKLGLSGSERTIEIAVDYALPLLLIGAALLAQLRYGLAPLIL